ncbi:hypothetical protein Mal65_11840 [Crateriforma conspicua]|nr:hypothetical protein Mal65_11840 [Crateriforma conspicua]
MIASSGMSANSYHRLLLRIYRLIEDRVVAVNGMVILRENNVQPGIVMKVWLFTRKLANLGHRRQCECDAWALTRSPNSRCFMGGRSCRVWNVRLG